MKEFIKLILNKIGVYNFASQIAMYSPFKLIKAIKARNEYDKYYDKACKNYPDKILRNNILDSNGIISLENILNIKDDVIKSVNLSYENGKVISYSYGFYKQGIDKNAEYSYLTKQSIIDSGLCELVLSSETIPLLQNHLGCYVRIVNLTVFKTYPTNYSNRGSFIWHRDSQPSNSYKLIVYLTHTKEDNGAFRYLLGTHKSYSRLPQYGNSRLTSASYSQGQCFEGRIGDGVLFDINGYHLGGRCELSSRIVLVTHFKPSIEPCSEHIKKWGFGSVTDSEYSSNPDKIWW